MLSSHFSLQQEQNGGGSKNIGTAINLPYFEEEGLMEDFDNEGMIDMNGTMLDTKKISSTE